jgi:hypothetical protein
MDEPMRITNVVRRSSRATWRAAVSALGITLAAPACGSGATMSGVAVGTVGRGLSVHSQTVPRGAQVCALREALQAPAHGAPKPISEACGKAWKSDQLWQRAMVVLAAHAEKLEGVASGSRPESAGQLEAALTGVRDADWIETEDGTEQAARNAVAQLVTQMGTSTSKRDLGKAVQDAAPHVKTLCDGLDAYFDTQMRDLAQIQDEVEEKRASHANRRCAMVEQRTICVSQALADHLVYANTFGQVAALASSHLEARAAIADFCTVHRKLEAAAAEGRLATDRTYVEIVEAVRAAPRPQPVAAEAAQEQPEDEGKEGSGDEPKKPEKK